jgi:hypothetical protein
MAMHIHASLSEGSGSMDAHLSEAQRTGVDVIWWTDHDFRKTAAGYRQAVGFNGLQEPDPQTHMSWEWVPRLSGPLGSSSHTFVATPHSADEAGGALRLQAAAGSSSSWGYHLLEGQAGNATYSTSYADTKLTLDVLPQQLSDNAEIVVEIASSYRPASGGRPAGYYKIQYRIGRKAGRWTENNGLLGVVAKPAGAAYAWQRIVMDLRADHALLWPDTVAGDASLWRLRVGVRARNGATARAVVDRLRFDRARKTPADGAALLRSLMSQYRDRYPGVVQHEASEISLVNHMNAFGGDGTLPSYGSRAPHMDGSLAAQQEMVKFLHSHGALACLNHPLGGLGTKGLAQRLITTNGVGADVIEVGISASIEQMAWVYDVAARNAVFLTANGVTDDHGGTDWLGDSHPRWVTGAWSRSSGTADLCRALKAGAAWFYDPKGWSGELDLTVQGSVQMGGVLFNGDKRVTVDVAATRLPSYGSLELIVGSCDRPGTSDLQPKVRSVRIPARDVVRGRWSTDIGRGEGCYIRAMIRQADQKIVGFSNPVWVLPERLQDTVVVPRIRRHVLPGL